VFANSRSNGVNGVRFGKRKRTRTSVCHVEEDILK
jgi:hypothetical protein